MWLGSFLCPKPFLSGRIWWLFVSWQVLFTLFTKPEVTVITVRTIRKGNLADFAKFAINTFLPRITIAFGSMLAFPNTT